MGNSRLTAVRVGVMDGGGGWKMGLKDLLCCQVPCQRLIPL